MTPTPADYAALRRYLDKPRDRHWPAIEHPDDLTPGALQASAAG